MKTKRKKVVSWRPVPMVESIISEYRKHYGCSRTEAIDLLIITAAIYIGNETP